MSDPADALTDYLIDRARTGFDAIGQEIEDDLRQRVSVPVEYDGKRVIRSKPGEAPRTEFGDYERSMHHATRVEGDRVVTEAGTNMDRGVWFTEGTDRMRPRPHFEDARAAFAERAEERVKQALSQP